MTAPTPAGPPPVWTVKRRWIPRLGAETLWHRFRRRFRRTRVDVDDGADVASGCFEFAGDGIAVAIALVAFLLVVFLVVIPALVALVDLLVLLVLALLALGARILLGRPWLIEARDGTGRVLRWRVVGWRESGERRDAIASVLAEGAIPSDAEVLAEGPIPE